MQRRPLTPRVSTVLSAVLLAACHESGGPSERYIAFVLPPPSVTTRSGPITPPVQVAVLDAVGNTVTTATDSVTVALAANPGAATLSGTLTVAATQGIATFSNLRIDLPGNGYTLAASAAGLGGATSAPFAVPTYFDVAHVQGASDTLIADLRDSGLVALTALGARIYQLLHNARVAPPPTPFGEIPSSVLGRHYLLETVSGEYVVAAAPSADPASVEFVLYASDSALGQPLSPLTELGLYRLRHDASLPFTVERAADTTVDGTSVISTGFQTGSLEVTAVGAVPRGRSIHFLYRRSFQNTQSGEVTELRSGDPQNQIVLTRSSESGMAFDMLSQNARIGDDSITIGSSSIDFREHVYANGVEISTSSLSEAEKQALAALRAAFWRSAQIAAGLAKPLQGLSTLP